MTKIEKNNKDQLHFSELFPEQSTRPQKVAFRKLKVHRSITPFRKYWNRIRHVSKRDGHIITIPCLIYYDLLKNKRKLEAIQKLTKAGFQILATI